MKAVIQTNKCVRMNVSEYDLVEKAYETHPEFRCGLAVGERYDSCQFFERDLTHYSLGFCRHEKRIKTTDELFSMCSCGDAMLERAIETI